MIYCCIDLKSFFASVECVERGLDPFQTNLVVADPQRGRGSICLAVSPRMKSLGVRNRCRVFEIPENIEYITATPRMRLYMKYSADIYGIYLNFISKDDIHVYSIDECFINLTPYLKLYGKDGRRMAQMLRDAVFEKTGITATCGVGTNLFLAKIALDITAKKTPDGIGCLDEDIFKKTVWYHKPITDIWNIGTGIARRLEKYGAYNLHDVALMDKNILYKEFGVNAEFLIDHANGIEPCTIDDIHAYKSKSKSLSNGQILFEDYDYVNAMLVMKEMADNLVLELVDKGLTCGNVSLYIGYSKDVIKSTGGSSKLSQRTNSFRKILGKLTEIYNRTTDRDQPIRKINISFNDLSYERENVLDLFGEEEMDIKEEKVQKAVIGIKKALGKNAIMKAMSYKEKATGIARNGMVGGHKG
ncbi:MAG: DNA repair protein [Armatimonadetes bacterium]|nr:DNA repair protein [Candidatus Hippobium faecium]